MFGYPSTTKIFFSSGGQYCMKGVIRSYNPLIGESCIFKDKNYINAKLQKRTTSIALRGSSDEKY
jgi:hypothetical protein